MWEITVIYKGKKVTARPISFEKIGETYLLDYGTHQNDIPAEAVLNITNVTNPNYKFKK